jgi:hypothetical protein
VLVVLGLLKWLREQKRDAARSNPPPRE